MRLRLPDKSRRPLGACVLAGIGVAGWVASCSTVEPPAFSDGDCVAGGCVQTGASSSASSSSGMCTVDPGCAVSWGKDIFAGILDGPAGCTSMPCHGGGIGGITLASGQSADAYNTLMGYTLASTPGPAKKYIVPCSPAGSGFPCNMSLGADGGANPNGACGSLMPFGASAPVTMDELTKIDSWITCGAPDN